MSDEIETQEVESPEEVEEDVSKLSHEDALKALKKARTEAAARRVKNKESEEKAAKWEEHVKSQMTENERLIAENSELKATNEALKVERLRSRIAAEVGLDPSLTEFLTGSEKDMKAQAAKLLEKGGKAGTKAPDFYAGQRGNTVTPKAENLNDFFTQMWRESEQTSGKRKFTS